MIPIVLDCSVTIAASFGDETSDYAEFAVQQSKIRPCYVPSIWPLEVANTLMVAERRKRIRPGDFDQYLTAFFAIDLIFDNHTAEFGLTETLLLARSLNLSAYDASYLELSRRLGAELATLDRKLQRAAKESGVNIFQPESL